MASIFSKIIEGSIPSVKVDETEKKTKKDFVTGKEVKA